MFLARGTGYGIVKSLPLVPRFCDFFINEFPFGGISRVLAISGCSSVPCFELLSETKSCNLCQVLMHGLGFVKVSDMRFGTFC